ncbi:hypothetical protein ILUMI_12228 [Ignelater luminosus]|uniref:DUF659 domain-containing protein n=1 Tax=Ignelater luminosus TaxID=2038154 RepID=A0A8K0GBZ8_IGNLU|nr:hypothetical protein ILUMI_12228 [Ignelater luminosus]
MRTFAQLVLNMNLWVMVKIARASWNVPSRKILSGSRLDKEFTRVSEEIKVSISQAENVALDVDAWSNIRNEYILNYTVLTPKPYFIKSVTSETNRHTAEYLCDLMIHVLEKYGPDKFLVIITDNAANEKKLHYILKLDSIDKILKSVVAVIKTIKNSHILTAAFIKERNADISLSLPVLTRWGSHPKVLDDFIKSKSTLQKLAVNKETANFFSRENKANIPGNEVFLVQTWKLAELIRPIVKWIHLLESDGPVSLSPIAPDEEKMIFEKFTRRHEYAVQPIHLAAVILDPKDLGVNLDPEELLNGIEFIDTLSKTMTNIDLVVVLTSLTKYRNKESMWDKEVIWKTVESLEPLTWWKGVGSINCRQLARVAIRILSMPTSSASTERTNSTQREEKQINYQKKAEIVQESYQNQKRLKSSDNRTTKRRKGDLELEASSSNEEYSTHDTESSIGSLSFSEEENDEN